MMRPFVILLLTCSVRVDGQARSTMIDLGTYFTRNLRLTNQSVFRTLNPPSFSHCVKACVLSTSCQTLTFDLNNGLCELANSGANYQQTADQSHVTTISSAAGVIPPYVPALAGVCDGNNCPEATTCIPLSAGVTHCAISECPQPGPVANAYSHSLRDQSVGAVISYTCDTGYTLVGAPNRTCKADGNWEGVAFTCQLPTTTTTTTTTPAFQDPSQYTNFNDANDECGGDLPLLNSQAAISAFTSALTGSMGYCANCPNVLIAGQSSLTLYSDNWPDVNPRFGACSCLLNTNKADYKIQLDIITIDMEPCCDNIWVYDGPDETAMVLGKYTDELTVIQTIVSSGNELYIEFRSDEWVEYSGFEIVYTEVSVSTSSTPGVSLPPPGALPLLFWVLGQIDEVQMIWTLPDGTALPQTPIMSPSISYIADYYNSTGIYYNNVPFSDYGLCFNIVSQMLLGVAPGVTTCHVACQIPAF